jgi:4-amino-4-deoxy-L-arabinose transferase-like glycosyltransferase
MSSSRAPLADEFDPPEIGTGVPAPSCYRPALSHRRFAALVLIFLIVTRWPLGPAYLYSFDSVNFALALENFNPTLHQPQPPGYALFVAFTRFLHLVFRRPEDVFLAAGIITACVSVVVIRMVASEMFGANAGLIAAVLLLSHPVFWFAGVTNQIRLFLALSSATIALMAWRAFEKDLGGPWLLRGFAVLGIAAGFRPVESILLLAPMLWAWFRTGRSLRLLAAGLVVLLAIITPWIWFTAAAVGGLTRWVHLM